MTVDLRSMFEPRGVVVVGASSHPGKFGFTTLHNIISSGFAGEVHGVNLDRETILGVDTVADVAEIPHSSCDLMVVCTPAATVGDVLRAGAARGVTAAFVISAGFAEAGNDDAQADLEAAIADTGMAVAGPNGQGLVSTPASLCAQMVAPNPLRGGISIASQSGNLASAFQNLANQWGVGVARAVSAGNAVGLGVIDYLEWFADDDETTVCLAYLEGLDDGADFFGRVAAVAEHKPVVLLKGGASAAGATAAASHTGSLATDDRVFDGMLRQAGVVRASTVRDAFAAAAAFARLPLPDGPNVAVVTTVGGWGVLTADAIDVTDLELMALPDDLRAEIDTLLPPRWSRSNPIDLAGGETRDTVPDVLRLVAAHREVDAVINLGLGVQSGTAALLRAGGFHPDHGLDRIVAFHERQDARYAQAAVEVTDETGTPVLVATELATAEPDNPGPAELRSSGFPCFGAADEAVRALAAMHWYASHRRRRST